jgi:hypothetical protein
VWGGVAELLADTFQRDRSLAEDERALVVQALMATHKHAHRGRKPDHDGQLMTSRSIITIVIIIIIIII